MKTMRNLSSGLIWVKLELLQLIRPNNKENLQVIIAKCILHLNQSLCEMRISLYHSSTGPVCVVSIAGPYRKGKSYILSQAFDQPDVFPLGHKMEAETMGIWIWIVPEKFKVCLFIEFGSIL